MTTDKSDLLLEIIGNRRSMGLSRLKPDAVDRDLIAKMRKVDQATALRTHARFAPINPNTVLTLPGGVRQHCRVSDVSASGAAILSNARPVVGSIVGIGSLPSKVVREFSNGFAVQFLEIQRASLVEAALLAPLRDESLLHAA